MEKCAWSWMNGRFIKKPMIPADCQGFHYGLSAFEGIRFYRTHDGRSAIFRLKEHMERLNYSIACLGIESSFTDEELCSAIIKTIKRNKIKEGYVRPIIGFTDEAIGLKTNPKGATYIISIWDWPVYFSRNVRAMISSIARLDPQAFSTHAKIGGHYVNSFNATQEAMEKGFDSAILLDHRGYIAEAPVANIFVVKNRELLTPTPEFILPGITRKTILEIYSKINGIHEVDMSIKDLWDADEIFLCGTATEIVPVTFIDYENVRPRMAIRQKKVGNGKAGPITKKLQKLYGQIVRGEIPE